MSTLKFHSHFLHITKLNLNAFKKLVIMSRSNVTFFTNAAMDRIETAAASWADLLDAHKVDIPTIDFNAVNVKEDGFTNEDFTLDKDEKTDTNATAVANWLINQVTKLGVKVSEHSQLIKLNFNRDQAREKVMVQLQEEMVELRKYCNEVQQRSMKDNIIISPPNLEKARQAS